MPSQQRPARERLTTLITRAFHRLRSQVYEESPLMELTVQQLRTLFLLHVQETMRMSEISYYLGIGMPTVTNLVGKLEDKGLVAREHDTTDRRVVLCSVTERGKTEIEQFWHVRKEQIAHLTGSLSEEQVALVAQAMEIILQALKQNQNTRETGGQRTSSRPATSG